jgi:hypothetical protein
MEQYNSEKEFLFPFSTCEKPQKEGILAQPYSVVMNLIACVILLYFLSKTKRWYTFFFLLSLFIFESFHTFSHSMHLQDYITTKPIHIVAYITILFLFLSLISHFKNVVLSSFFYAFMTIMLIADVYSFLFLHFFFYFTTFMIMVIFLFASFYPYFLGSKKRRSFIIILLVITILLLFYNEKYNCKRMMDLVPGFPFHIFIETSTVFTFYFIGDFFYDF